MSLETPHNGGQLARVFALLTAAFVAWSAYALATSSLPPLAADRGRIDTAITLNLVISGIVFFGAHIALVVALIRRPREARIPRENVRVEALWTALTAVVLVALLVNSEIDARALESGGPRVEGETRWSLRWWPSNSPGTSGFQARMASSVERIPRSPSVLGRDPRLLCRVLSREARRHARHRHRVFIHSQSDRMEMRVETQIRGCSLPR